MKLYLASTSPARLMLLRQSGVEPVVVPSHVDEDAVIAAAESASGAALSPEDTVALLARAKAESVWRDLDGADGLILGGDSVFVVDGVIYGKPHTAAAARQRWLLQRGATGRLYSGHWLIEHRADGSAGGSAGAVAWADVTFAGDITDAELDAYIATGEPLQVAGAFTIDSLGAPFIERISETRRRWSGCRCPPFAPWSGSWDSSGRLCGTAAGRCRHPQCFSEHFCGHRPKTSSLGAIG